jgi:outer membrane protein, multidrug efflux system
MRQASVLILFVVAMSAVACQVGPKYRRPSAPIPQKWKETQEAEYAASVDRFWQVFDDSQLDALEQQAIATNPSLNAAATTVCEAWAQLRIHRSDLFPQIDLTPGYNAQEALFKLFVPGALAGPGLVTGLETPFRIRQYQFSLPVSMRYELDLFGRLKSQVKAAYRNAQAQREAYCTALLSLTTLVAQTYYHIRALDAQIELLERTAEVRNQTLDLSLSRETKGLTGASDTASARVNLANIQANLQEAKRERGVQESILATLVGIPAPCFFLPPSPLAAPPPSIPAGLPSEVLCRRPDVREAERRMASQHALVRSAYATYFPSFELTGALGFFSPTLKDFLSWKSRLWEIGAGAAQSLFDAGRRKATVEEAWARFAQAKAGYRQQVLTAFEEVEQALVELQTEHSQAISLSAAVDAAVTLNTLALNRYNHGLTNYLDVTTAEESRLNAESRYIALLDLQYQSTIQLIKAIGGSWSAPSPPSSCNGSTSTQRPDQRL